MISWQTCKHFSIVDFKHLHVLTVQYPNTPELNKMIRIFLALLFSSSILAFPFQMDDDVSSGLDDFDANDFEIDDDSELTRDLIDDEDAEEEEDYDEPVFYEEYEDIEDYDTYIF